MLYKRNAVAQGTGLGRFLGCRKCKVLVTTQALVHCLICPHLPKSTQCPQASAEILGNALISVLQLLCV